MARHWRDIASELAKEENRDRLLELAAELAEALDERMARLSAPLEVVPQPAKKENSSAPAGETARKKVKPA